MADQIIEVPGQGNVAFPADMSDADIARVIQRQVIQAHPPGMPKAPVPSELQPDAGPRRALETYPQNMVDKLHQMGEVMHDLGTAVSTGDWNALQKKYPPTEPKPTVGGLAQTAGGGYKSALQSVGIWPEFRTDPRTGKVDPWATVGATLSNMTMAGVPLLGEIRGINEEFPTPPRLVEEAAPEAAAAGVEAGAAAEPKLTLAQRYPQATVNLARVAGGGVGAMATPIFGPYVGGITTMLGKEIAEQWAKKITRIPEPEAAPMPTPAAAPEAEAPPLPPRTDAQRLADAITAQYGDNIPESNAKIPAHLYRQIQTASPHMPEPLTDAQIRGLGEDVLNPQRKAVADARAAAEARRAPAPEAAAEPTPPSTATRPTPAPMAPPTPPPEAAAAPTAPPTATRPLEEAAITPPAEAAPSPGRRTMAEAEAETYREAQVVRTAPEPPASARVKMQITEAEKVRLRDLGYTKDDLYRMKPAEAADILVKGRRAPSAAPTPPPEALKTYAGTPTTREESAAAWRAWQRGEGPAPPRPAPGQTSAEAPLEPIPAEHAPFGGTPGAEVPETYTPALDRAFDDNDLIVRMREHLARAPYAEHYSFDISEDQYKAALKRYKEKMGEE